MLSPFWRPETCRRPGLQGREPTESTGRSLGIWSGTTAWRGEVAYQVPKRLTRMAAGLICLALFLSTATSYFFARKNYKSLMGIVDIFDKATHGQELPALSQRITDVYNYILYNIVETFLQNDFLQVQLSERAYKLGDGSSWPCSPRSTPIFS